jgi:hypothetical protein
VFVVIGCIHILIAGDPEWVRRSVGAGGAARRGRTALHVHVERRVVRARRRVLIADPVDVTPSIAVTDG